MTLIEGENKVRVRLRSSECRGVRSLAGRFVRVILSELRDFRRKRFPYSAQLCMAKRKMRAEMRVASLTSEHPWH